MVMKKSWQSDQPWANINAEAEHSSKKSRRDRQGIRDPDTELSTKSFGEILSRLIGVLRKK